MGKGGIARRQGLLSLPLVEVEEEEEDQQQVPSIARPVPLPRHHPPPALSVLCFAQSVPIRALALPTEAGPRTVLARPAPTSSSLTNLSFFWGAGPWSLIAAIRQPFFPVRFDVDWR